ncbi:bifunctional riboflavin kinase/FAD synthetase [Fulvivirgaceae bacterium BMA10]|uniref:Riboflavin biosynthesis protein n=1 Tax=Splendidivirga corallicola TaxID=3051826 RepID=A0ABT8KK84_9BACT|nr:bifunctional riboflavin kinase/FAD synthetase [Fulvivirgaceae bacterium BMA10]
MKIHEGVDNFPKLNFPVVTSGTFDGVHIGHQKILEKLREIVRQNKGESVLLTFWPHPRMVLHSHKYQIKLLSTFEEKAELLEARGVDHLIKIPFTPEFSQLTSEEFVRNILVNSIGTKKLVIGYDHRFGKNREGGFEYLSQHAAQLGFEVEEIPQQDIEDVAVSSSRIRNALNEGNVKIANKYLDRAYSIKGTIIKGAQLGRSIGFPTANIKLDNDYKLIPADGAYAVHVQFEQHLYRGMLNIGNRPTVNGSERTIEVNIFNFDKDIYKKEIKVSFVDQIRKEIKFPNVEALRKQLMKDRELANDILNG